MKYCGKDLWGSKQEMKNMIYNRKMLFDTDYWEVLEFKDAWQLVKHGVSMTYLKECLLNPASCKDLTTVSSVFIKISNPRVASSLPNTIGILLFSFIVSSL